MEPIIINIAMPCLICRKIGEHNLQFAICEECLKDIENKIKCRS
jgi:hypothetical protein